MSYPTPEFWPGWQTASEPLQEVEDDLFNAYLNLDPEAYEYPHVPSTLDETSTFVGSELDAPPLTFGPTLTPSTRSKASPSLAGGPPEEADHHGPSLSRLAEGGTGLGFLPFDTSTLRHIGENPEIQVQESLSSPPKQLCLDDAALGLSPRSPLLPAGSPSQPNAMKRGRSNPLPAEKRVKVSTMRKIKACPWCRIHKVECKEISPCNHCKKNFPGYPEEACDRAKLCEVRFPEFYQPRSIWPHNSRDATPYTWQPPGNQTNTTMTFEQSLEECTRLAPALQSYVANSSRFPLLSQGYYPPYPSATPSDASLSIAGFRPGNFMSQRAPGNLVFDEPQSSPDNLLPWAERQLSIELEKDKGRRFPAAVGAILLANRDSSLGVPGAGSRPVNVKKQTIFDSAKDLVRKVIKMQCWLRVWQRPALYIRPVGAALQSSTANVSELRRTALTALIASEKEILTELDDLPFKLHREIQLPIWACLWQMILTYRDLINEHSGVNHGLMSSSTNFGHDTVLSDAPGTVERLHRLLVIKYAAYIGSSSPVFQKGGQESIRDLLVGDQRMQHEWDNVLERRKDFYQAHSEGVPCDAFLKALIIDKEANMERRRRRKPK